MYILSQYGIIGAYGFLAPFSYSLARLLPVADFPLRSGPSWLTFRLQNEALGLVSCGAHPSLVHCRGAGWEPQSYDGTGLAPGIIWKRGSRVQIRALLSPYVLTRVCSFPLTEPIWGNSESVLCVPREIAGRSGQGLAALSRTPQG